MADIRTAVNDIVCSSSEENVRLKYYTRIRQSRGLVSEYLVEDMEYFESRANECDAHMRKMHSLHLSIQVCDTLESSMVLPKL